MGYFFFKIYFIFNDVYVCLCLCVYVHVKTIPAEAKRGRWISCS